MSDSKLLPNGTYHVMVTADGSIALADDGRTHTVAVVVPRDS